MVGVLLCSLTLATPATAATQDGDVAFLVRPAPGSSTVAEGGYFLLEAGPGDEVSQTLELRNDSTEPVELQLAAVDAVTGAQGGASYGLATDAVTRTGGWITLDETTVPLEPGAFARIPFTVRVPSDVDSGEHLAGLSVAAVQDDGPVATEDVGAGASVDIRTRRVVAVQVNTPGPAEPELTIDGVRPAARAQGLYLEIDIDHVGTALARGEGTISLPGEDFERDFEIDTFIPRTSIAYPVQWTSDAREGSYQAKVEIRHDGRVTTWEGEVVVGDEVLDELAERQVEPPDDRTDWAGLWPWSLALLVSLLAGLAAYVVRRRRVSRPGPGRRRAAPQIADGRVGRHRV